MGRIPILEYHLIGTAEGRWERHHEAFRRDLELLYERGYRPVTVSQLVDGDFRLPAGLSPVVITFDDASPSQFRYIERPDGTLEIDSTTAVGIWLEFRRHHPDWENRAVFCLLSGAEAGRSFFGDRNIEGQKTAWRHRKIRFLAEQGFELCNHTLWHANLAKYSDEQVQEQIARGVLAIDSAVPGYRVRTFALPLGVWPKNRDLARRGSWQDPRSGRTVSYAFDAVLLVAGNPVPSPSDSAFDPFRLERVQVLEGTVDRVLAKLDRTGRRYVSAGAGAVTVAGGRPVTHPVGPRER
jgi:peptidoglycan/xylan/chitin deacetylase (PgdA/CDA1 family)